MPRMDMALPSQILMTYATCHHSLQGKTLRQVHSKEQPPAWVRWAGESTSSWASAAGAGGPSRETASAHAADAAAGHASSSQPTRYFLAALSRASFCHSRSAGSASVHTECICSAVNTTVESPSSVWRCFLEQLQNPVHRSQGKFGTVSVCPCRSVSCELNACPLHVREQRGTNMRPTAGMLASLWKSARKP